MKNLQFFFANLQWRSTLFLCGIITIILFLHQLLFLWIILTISGDISNFATIMPSLLFSLYLMRAFFFSVLICISLFLYICYCKFYIKRTTSIPHHRENSDSSPVEVQGNKKDDVGHLNQQLNDVVKELQRSVKMQKEQIRLSERNLLARELHDTVKQQIFALAFQISVARKIHSSENDQLAMHLLEAKNILRDIQGEVTNLIYSMHQGALIDQDLTDALAEYLSRWSHQYGIFAKFTIETEGQEKNYFLSAHVKNTFFRVAQEALSNVARHSNASSIHVTLTIGWLYIILNIADNGQGFNNTQQKNGGVGISSMQERMKEIGGSLSINSQMFSGTSVIATYIPKGTGPNIAMLITPKKDSYMQK